MQLEYEAREKAVRDYNQMMKEAELRGREAGEKIGRENTLKGAIEICHDLGLSIDETVIKIASKFSIAENEAKLKVNQYWNG